MFHSTVKHFVMSLWSSLVSANESTIMVIWPFSKQKNKCMDNPKILPVGTPEVDSYILDSMLPILKTISNSQFVVFSSYVELLDFLNEQVSISNCCLFENASGAITDRFLRFVDLDRYGLKPILVGWQCQEVSIELHFHKFS